MKNLICKKPVITMVVLLIVQQVGISLDIGDSIWGQIPNRLVLGVIMIETMYIVAGKEIFIWTKKSGKYALLRSSYALVLAGFSSIAVAVLMGSNNNFNYRVISYLLLSICVGLCEEGLYRGVIVNGLVKVMPETKRGLCRAIVISGLIFGFSHVWRYIPVIKINPVSVIVQMLAKIIIMGAFGMVLSAIYLKTKNIWINMIIHALYDFLLFLPLTNMELIEIKYVDATIIMNLDVFLFKIIPAILFSIPNVIIALKILKKLNPSECIIWK